MFFVIYVRMMDKLTSKSTGLALFLFLPQVEYYIWWWRPKLISVFKCLLLHESPSLKYLNIILNLVARCWIMMHKDI